MTVQKLNTLHTICELERNQLLTILAMSVQNPQLAGFLLTGNGSNFLSVERSTACTFLTSPVYPPLITPRDSISTQRDDYLIPILSNENFTFKSELTSLYMHPTYTFKLYDKNQDFFTSIASNIMTPYHYWLDNNVKNFSLQFTFLRPYMISKLMKMTLLFVHLHKKQLITKLMAHFFNIKNRKNTFSSTINTHRHIL